MAARGWQCVFGDVPECWVQAFDDVIRREGNTVYYQFNVAARTGNTYGQGYWDYPWMVDLSVDNKNLSTNRLIKPYTGWRRIIRGQEHWMHLHSGYYTGSVQVHSLATTIRLYIFFHDTMGHTGAAEYWIPIPRASAPYNLAIGESKIKTTSAQITASCMNTSEYSKVVKWELDYGESPSYGKNLHIDTKDSKATFDLSGLKTGTRYYYRARVTTDIGLSSEITGSFMTEDVTYAQRVLEGKPVTKVRAVAIYPDGSTKRIEGIKVIK